MVFEVTARHTAPTLGAITPTIETFSYENQPWIVSLYISQSMLVAANANTPHLTDAVIICTDIVLPKFGFMGMF